MRRIEALPGVNKALSAIVVPCAMPAALAPAFSFLRTAMSAGPAKEDPRAQFRTISPGFLPRWAFPSSPAAISISSNGQGKGT